MAIRSIGRRLIDNLLDGTGVEIDGVTLGNGQPGPISKRLREIYLEESRRTAI